MLSMQQIVEFLESNPIQIFSTSSHNKPISRPIGSAMFHKGKIWYCMNNDKPMFQQLQENPFVCICVCALDFNWIRIHAKVIFSNDSEIREIYVKRPTNSFKDSHDERLSVFYLSQIHAQLYKKGEKQEFILDY